MLSVILKKEAPDAIPFAAGGNGFLVKGRSRDGNEFTHWHRPAQ
jgi:hypothetical protein